MSLHLWLVYLGAVVLISGSPGPNMLLAMSHGIHHGLLRTAGSTMPGLLSGLAVILSISLGGLSAVLLASATAFAVLRYLGAAYLVYLGAQQWRRAGSGPVGEDGADAERGWARYRIGILVALSNPKAILFGVAFFPQFIVPGQPVAAQVAILLLTFLLVETGCMFVYAGGGARLARWLRQGTRIRWFDRATGSFFIAAGLALGLLRR